MNPEKCADRPFWIEDLFWNYGILQEGDPGGGFGITVVTPLAGVWIEIRYLIL
jgi:hypothetical protein